MLIALHPIIARLEEVFFHALLSTSLRRVFRPRSKDRSRPANLSSRTSATGSSFDCTTGLIATRNGDRPKGFSATITGVTVPHPPNSDDG